MNSAAPPPTLTDPSWLVSGTRQPNVEPPPRSKQKSPESGRYLLSSHSPVPENVQNQAELFYLQKQIQAKTSMVFVLANGEKIRGVIEWYDLHSIKVRGREKSLLYKASIKYMYKEGENGE
jgi:sRNA-binding regulator protein Hfq